MNIKRTLYLLLAVFLSFVPSLRSQDVNKKILKLISENQKSNYDTALLNGQDFDPLIIFASKGRSKLYKSNNISIGKPGQYILLEGWTPSNGNYSGIIFCDSIAIVYRNSRSVGWHILKIPISNKESISSFSGISRHVIERVSTWDIDYINHLKKVVGSTVSDGSNFIASKIDITDKNPPVIQTIYFYEFR